MKTRATQEGLSSARALANHELYVALYKPSRIQPAGFSRSPSPPLDLTAVAAALKGADPNQASGSPAETPLLRLINDREDSFLVLECVRLLLQAGADVTAHSPGSRLPIHAAAAEGWRQKGLQVLVEAGANPNTRDSNGWTSVHHLVALNETGWAFWGKRGDLIDVLLEEWMGVGASIDERAKNGHTPLEALLSHVLKTRSLTQEYVLKGVLALLNKGAVWTPRAERFSNEPAYMGQSLRNLNATEFLNIDAAVSARALEREVPMSLTRSGKKSRI